MILIIILLICNNFLGYYIMCLNYSTVICWFAINRKSEIICDCDFVLIIFIITFIYKCYIFVLHKFLDNLGHLLFITFTFFIYARIYY